MPNRGQYSAFDRDVSPEWRAFADALREMALACDASWQEISNWMFEDGGSALCRSSKSLSALAKGRRKRPPKVEVLRCMHKVTSEKARARGASHITWEELQDLWETLAPSLPEAAEAPQRCPTCGVATPLEQALALHEPAAQDSRADAAAATVAPVPPKEEDRRIPPDAYWPPVTDLNTYLVAGNLEAATRMLRHAGAEAAAGETADAIAACRSHDLAVAIEALHGHARGRPALEILHIVRSLNAHDFRSDADELIELVLGTRDFQNASGKVQPQ